jgi:thiamine-phosphate pyrophosphorylase
MDEDDLTLDPGFADRFPEIAKGSCELYLISPPRFDPGFPDELRAALDGGEVAAFQLRLKELPDSDILRAAEQLLPICREREVAFILNDRADLAKAGGADGVHLGQGDGDPRQARLTLGPSFQIGITCHDSRHLAMDAGDAGADYVAFGAFFPTTTKDAIHRPDPSILSWWSRLFELPCVAIGGITPENGRALVEAGADFLAVSSGVWAHPGGPAAALRAFEPILKR